MHYWLTIVLVLMLLPAAAASKVALAPPVYLLALFVRVSLTGIVVAGLLHFLDTPIRATLEAFRARPVRLVLPAAMAVAFAIALGWSLGLFLAAVATVVVEFLYRHPQHRVRTAVTLLAPGLYLLLGISLIFLYNPIAVSWRFAGEYDETFMRLDGWLGMNVPAISRQVSATAPQLLTVAEYLYFGMFDLLGGTLILIALRSGVERAMRFVGALVLAYYITLVLFVLFPSQGPYFLCTDHASTFPQTLRSYPLQMSLLAEARHLWEHTSTVASAGGYYISFPSMHIVKPAVALWYLRRSRVIVLLLLTYMVLLTPAIVVLEMHYFVDIPVGLAIAAFVTYISERPSRSEVVATSPRHRAA